MRFKRGDEVFGVADGYPMKVIAVQPNGQIRCQRGIGKSASVELYSPTAVEKWRQRSDRLAKEEAVRKADMERKARDFADHFEKMQEHALTHRPSEVLRLLIEMVPDAGSAHIIFHFKKAFPDVPLKTCIDAQAPARLYEGGITDEQFDALFAPWWPSGQY
jgi:hypothetical protein